MDRTNELDLLASSVVSIDANMVDSWNAALNGFASALFDAVPASNEGI